MLSPSDIEAVLVPYLRMDDEVVAAKEDPPQSSDADRVAAMLCNPALFEKLADYLELLLRWNARTNLTAIREPEQIIRRHFGESLFLGIRIRNVARLLDFGSGAGFPGVPIQILRPEILVTLAECQIKKAAFLHEVNRTLRLAAEVWPGRVEALPTDRVFDAVSLRAVDDMSRAIHAGSHLRVPTLYIFSSVAKEAATLDGLRDFTCTGRWSMPDDSGRFLLELKRTMCST